MPTVTLKWVDGENGKKWPSPGVWFGFVGERLLGSYVPETRSISRGKGLETCDSKEQAERLFKDRVAELNRR